MRVVKMGCAIALAFLGVARGGAAQTTLERGDVAFTGYNSGGADEVAFVLLKSVAAGTSISFTERGWLAAGGFRAGEATFTLTFGADYACGSQFRTTMAPLAVFDASSASAGLVTGGGHALSTSGDQVFAFQGSEPSAANESSLLAAIQMNGAWDADATSANASARPISLGDGVHAVAIAPEVDNARYDCSQISGTPEALGAAVNDPARWLRNDAVPFDLSISCGFTCAAGPTPTQLPTPSLTPPILTPTPTAIPTPDPGPTETPTTTPTSMPTALATATPAPTAPPSPVAPTATPEPTAIAEPTGTPTVTGTPVATGTPSITSTPSPSPESTATPTATPTVTASPAPPTPTLVTPAPTSDPTATPSPLASATPSATPTAGPTSVLPTPTVPAVPPQSKGQQRCILALNRGLLAVAKAQAAEIARCTRSFAKGKEPSAEACVSADAKGVVQRARDAVARDAVSGCAELPSFGPGDAAIVAAAGVESARGVVADLLGDLDTGVALTAARERSRCQQTLLAAARRCHEAQLAEFNRCKQKGLKSGAITTAESLAACVGGDAKGKVAQACDLAHDGDATADPLRRALRDVCVDKGVAPSEALPVCSGASDVEAAHACIVARVACRSCGALAASDGLAVDCDARDDGLVNASCVP